MSITHTFVSPMTDGPVPTQIQPSKWNEAHTVNLADEYTSAVHVDLRKTCTLDGVTNDTTAAQAAITTLAALGGGNIYVAQGKTLLTDRLSHSTAGVTVRIYGPGEIRLRTTNDALLKVTAGTLSLDHGLILNGNSVALTNDASCLALATGGKLTCRNIEVKNSGHCGIGNNTGGELVVTAGCNIHDNASFQIHVMGTGRFLITDNFLKDGGDTGVFCGPINNGATPCISEGGYIGGNIITNMRADDGGTGQHGNGINIYRNSNICVGPNNIQNVAWSFVRINDADDWSVTGIVGVTAGETGIWAELGATDGTIANCKVSACQSYGIVATNLPGLKGITITGCNVTRFGLSATPLVRAGIVIEKGIVTGCFVDGNNNPSAIWGIKCSPGAGTGLSWQTQVTNNHIAGCKYHVGVAVSATSGTQRMIIGHNMDARNDANFSSPIGAVGGSDSDAGNGSAIGALMAAKIHWDHNYWNVPTAERPPPGEVGSTLKVNNVWQEQVGGAWV